MATTAGSGTAHPSVVRDISVDIVRGFAIACMVMANMTPACVVRLSH